MRSLILSALLLVASAAGAHDFGKLFCDTTMRVDVVITTVDGRRQLSIDSVSQSAGWHGRRANLERPQYVDAIEIAVIDAAGDTLYTDAKYLDPAAWYDDRPGVCSTLFVPRPRSDARISVSVYSDNGKQRRPWLTVTRELGTELGSMPCRTQPATPYRYIRRAADPARSISLAIVAEGYTEAEMDVFMRDALKLDSALMAEPAFSANADRFDVVAVMLVSDESGVSRPSKQRMRRTALGAQFDSFNLDRLITVPDARRMWDALDGVPASQVLILANTTGYGGSGPSNEYAIASSHNKAYPEILIHEFGHSFAHLADEYQVGEWMYYAPDIEPMEPNITTLVDFGSKWRSMVESGEASLYEGAGYQSRGVWRGCRTCLMRTLGDRHFCPVCTRAINSTILYLTEQL